MTAAVLRLIFVQDTYRIPSPITTFSFSLLCSSINPSLFHSLLKTYLFHKSFTVVSLLPPGLHGLSPGPFFSQAYGVFSERELKHIRKFGRITTAMRESGYLCASASRSTTMSIQILIQDLYARPQLCKRVSTERLRSASSLDYIVPRTKTSLLPVRQYGTV